MIPGLATNKINGITRTMTEKATLSDPLQHNRKIYEKLRTQVGFDMNGKAAIKQRDGCL